MITRKRVGMVGDMMGDTMGDMVGDMMGDKMGDMVGDTKREGSEEEQGARWSLAGCAQTTGCTGAKSFDPPKRLES
jgi:hypothetical protein